MDKVHLETKVKRITSKNIKETGTAMDSSGNGNLETKFQDELNKKRRCDPLQSSASPTTCSWEGPCMMPLLSIPSVEECNNSYAPPIVLTGTARKAGTGPSVGAVDIGVSKSAYFFQVALPGVKKDPGLLFSLTHFSSFAFLFIFMMVTTPLFRLPFFLENRLGIFFELDCIRMTISGIEQGYTCSINGVLLLFSSAAECNLSIG